MEDIQLLDTIERYLNGNMLPEEKKFFEQIRKSTPEIDQMVVEHKLFLNQIGIYAEHRNLKSATNTAYDRLIQRGDLNEGTEIGTKARVIQLWQKYKRVTAIAASIAGVTALVISGLFTYFTPSSNQTYIQELGRKLNMLEKKTTTLNNELKSNHINIPKENFISGGTGFLIDGKGYIITNAHILKGTGAIVANKSGQEFSSRIVYIDKAKDMAVLKIDDVDFKPLSTLPYNIKKNSGDLGEDVYTLGYPRNDDITYNKGYLSAKSGHDGDTASLQISLFTNPGNSGGPVFNKNGEVIGILSKRETNAEGVVFAIKSKGIYQLIDDLKKSDTSSVRIKIPTSNKLRGKEIVDQVKLVEDCVFLVKAYN